MVGEEIMNESQTIIDLNEKIDRLEAHIEEYEVDQLDANKEIARLENIISTLDKEYSALEQKYEYLVNAVQDANQLI
jgi:chromosome segregation ATPase